MKKVISVLVVLLLVSCLNKALASNRIDSLNIKNKEEQFMKEMQEVSDFLEKCGVFFIATADGDQPRVRPFGAVGIFENRLYIQTAKKKRVSQQMKANPKIEICALDLSIGKWLRIEATVVEDDRLEAKQFMLDKYPDLKSIYSADDDNTQTLYLKNVTATFSSFTEEPREVKF